MNKVFAQGIYNPALDPNVGQGEPLDILNFFISNFLGIIFIVAVLVALTYFIMGAITLSLSSGDKNKILLARDKMEQAIIGLLLLFCVFAIMKLLGSLFGIEQLKTLIFNLEPFLVF